MSTPDYPLLTVPGYELYQLAHLTPFVVDALARHRRAAEARISRAAGPPLLSRRPLMQLMPARHGSPQPPAGLPPRLPPCPVRALCRPIAPPGHPVTAPQPDLRPLPLHGRRRLPGRRPLPSLVSGPGRASPCALRRASSSRRSTACSARLRRSTRPHPGRS